MDISLLLKEYGILVKNVQRNSGISELYEHALKFEAGTMVTDKKALAVRSGEKTGRSPNDKRIVKDPKNPQGINEKISWGEVNKPLSPESYSLLRKDAIEYLNTRETLFVIDGFAGWDPLYRLKVRVITTRAYHALFMKNMLIKPSENELKDFTKVDFVIFNAGETFADQSIPQVSSPTSVSVNFQTHEMVILGTQYAGEMKKGVFTIMNFLMPDRGLLSMHCSANVGKTNHDLTLFFGLSGTGKTTLSADPQRLLIGDDEHCWADQSIFNIEGGCYAKCINLSEDKEPEIYRAIRYGSVLENVVVNPQNGAVDYNDSSITENTRCSYPLEYMESIRLPAIGPKPTNIIFLTCDAFGVLPPISQLSPEQAMYHFISGYTAKVAGTEMGVKEPQTTFSACFGAAFMVWSPAKYASLLAQKIKKEKVNVWLVNTGWTGGGPGVGKRISLKHTRTIIDSIHSGLILKAEFRTDAIFGLRVPKTCGDLSEKLLWPKYAWANGESYEEKAKHLAKLFKANFEKFKADSSPEVLSAGPCF
jgi:phosphoenolpyruvate carboxykinase (ATP)